MLSYSTAQSGIGAPWSSTAIQAFTCGRRARMASSLSANPAWNTIASASALSKR